MEPISRSSMSSNSNTTVASAINATSAVAGLLRSPSHLSVPTVTSNAKTNGPCHNDNLRVLQHCSNSSNVIQHHQYPPILVAPSPLVPPSLIHPTQTSPLLSTPPQLMLPATTTTTPGSIPQFQQHGGSSHQMVTNTASTVPVSGTPGVMPTSNITTAGMALSPFGILPHERVVPHHIPHRHQHKKLSSSLSSKTLMDTSSSQILNTPAINSQRFYVEPTHHSNKMKQYDSIQQQQHRAKMANVTSDKHIPPVVSSISSYSPHLYDQRYQPRTTPNQVGYLSVITRTAVTTSNGGVMNDIATNSNYYQAQPIPLQTKTSDNHDRHYYHFDGTVPASQTPQQQMDNMLLMGTPVQRGDPMHIVKNLQSMQSDIDCYGVKKMIEQPRLLATDHNKTVGPATLLNNSSKFTIEHQHQHLQQLPKSAVIDSSSSYNSQYFDRRQPPPAHLHQHNQPHLPQHLITGNTKHLPTPTPLAVVSANGNTYLDVHQHQRHHRWNLDQHKPSTVSTSSCFSPSVFNQPSLPQQHQTYNNTVPTFNGASSASSILQQQQISQPTHNNNFIVTSENPMYYNPTTTIVSPSVTSVTTTSPPISLYHRQHHSNRPQPHPNNYHDLTNNLKRGNYVVNDDNRSPSVPNVIVPNIEQELSHLCDDSNFTSSAKVKLLNVITPKPSFIDSYIKFIHGGNNNTVKEEDEMYSDKKLLVPPLSSSTPKPMSKPYIPLPKPKIVLPSEQTPSRKLNEDRKTSNVSTTTTSTDDDPRYFPLPKTSSSLAGISDDRSDGSNAENSCLSDEDHDQWWITSSRGPGLASTTATTLIKNKDDVEDKKKKNIATLKKKQTNSGTTTKKQKTQHEQPRRQLSHRMAKEKTKLLSSIDELEIDDDEDILSDTDSDIDPAWIPNSDDNDATKHYSSNTNRRQFRHKKYSKVQSSISERLPSTSPSINVNNNNNQLDDSTEPMPFKSGTFVALKSQFRNNGKTIPQQLWRVDGKSLLQKFQRCNGDDVYKSVSTYTGWSPSHYSMYCQVDIRFVTSYKGVKVIPNKSSSSDLLVQLLCRLDTKKSAQNNSVVNTKTKTAAYSHTSEEKVNAFNYMSSMNSTASAGDQSVMLRANFDVYIQSLVSQALDSNFLGEIYRENDEYFLSNIRAIETVTQTCLQAIDSATTRYSGTDLSKVENIRTLISRFPDMVMCSVDVNSVKNMQLRCTVCGFQGLVGKQKHFVEINMSGTEYNSQTLKNIENARTFLKIIPMKQDHCCSSVQCIDRLIILHSLEHLKYHIYRECCERITIENNKSCNESTQDSTSVLNRLLADDEWIGKLFQMVCNTWSRAKNFVPGR